MKITQFESPPNENNRPKKPEKKDKDTEQGYNERLKEYNKKYTRYIKNKEHNLKVSMKICTVNAIDQHIIRYLIVQNLPSLDKLVNETQESRNYFIWFRF